MIEFIKHILGICGDHWIQTFGHLASSPIIATTIHWVKCKCGGWFRHKKNCENNLDNSN